MGRTGQPDAGWGGHALALVVPPTRGGGASPPSFWVLLSGF